MRILTPNEVDSRIENDPANTRERRTAARSIADIGSWNAELELRHQERAYKSARKGAPHVGGISDSFPQGTPKHRKANTNTRRNFNANAICISFTPRHRDLYFYGKPIGFYFAAYENGHLTSGELDSFVQNLKLMEG